MFKYRQEQRQKMTQHILSRQFTADTLTPALKINPPFDLMRREGKPPSPLTHVYLTPSRPPHRYCPLSAVRSSRSVRDAFTCTGAFEDCF